MKSSTHDDFLVHNLFCFSKTKKPKHIHFRSFLHWSEQNHKRFEFKQFRFIILQHVFNFHSSLVLSLFFSKNFINVHRLSDVSECLSCLKKKTLKNVWILWSKQDEKQMIWANLMAKWILQCILNSIKVSQFNALNKRYLQRNYSIFDGVQKIMKHFTNSLITRIKYVFL